ncbi:Carnosine N-methyltransferase [Balamuthia mandrillaris]
MRRNHDHHHDCSGHSHHHGGGSHDHRRHHEALRSFNEEGRNDTEEGAGEETEEDAELEEQRVFQKTVNAFRYYRSYFQLWLRRMERDWQSLPTKHQALLPDMEKKFIRIRQCLSVNQDFANLIVEEHRLFGRNAVAEGEEEQLTQGTQPRAEDFDKVRSTLKQFMREWSEEGKAERDACFGPLIEEVERRFPITPENRNKVKVLVPGGGLGRLAWEFACRGYASQGNEFSYFMLISSNFILNRVRNPNVIRIFPFITSSANVYATEDQFRVVTVPDVNPASEALLEADFSMCAGDFLEVYTAPNEWDCVCTCFFLDTAKNIIAYVETIYNILKEGGVWVNLGPLLYHWSDMQEEQSIELSFEELKQVMESFGFQIEKEERKENCYYDNDSRSMLQPGYHPVFFVATKPKSSSST